MEVEESSSSLGMMFSNLAIKKLKEEEVKSWSNRGRQKLGHVRRGLLANPFS